MGSSPSEKDAKVGPEVGSTSAFSSCIPTGIHGPTCIFCANLPPFSLMGSSLILDAASERWSQVCLEGYASDPPALAPRSIGCGHTFCTGCIARMLEQLPRHGKGHKLRGINC